MKRNILSILLAIVLITAMLTGISLSKTKYNQSKSSNNTQLTMNTQLATQEDITEIYIINGDHETEGWFDGPTKSEFLQALMEYPEHLFITPTLWKSFCVHRGQQLKALEKKQIKPSLENLEVKDTAVYNKNDKNKSFSQDEKDLFNLATVVGFKETEWDFYDTGAGLYYLKPKKSTADIGLKIESFIKIENPCKLESKKSSTSWVDGFIQLFDTTRWEKVHQNGKKAVICISGHGTPRKAKKPDACGVPANDFAKLVLFFDNVLKINSLGVQTCYWPASRILELMKEHGKECLNCSLITPIDQERAVFFISEMPLVLSYESASQATEFQEEQQGDILLTGLHDIATSFDGTMTPELNDKLNNIRIVERNHKHNMKTSLVDAGSTTAILI